MVVALPVCSWICWAGSSVPLPPSRLWRFVQRRFPCRFFLPPLPDSAGCGTPGGCTDFPTCILLASPYLACHSARMQSFARVDMGSFHSSHRNHVPHPSEPPKKLSVQTPAILEPVSFQSCLRVCLIVIRLVCVAPTETMHSRSIDLLAASVSETLNKEIVIASVGTCRLHVYKNEKV